MTAIMILGATLVTFTGLLIWIVAVFGEVALPKGTVQVDEIKQEIGTVYVIRDSEVKALAKLGRACALAIHCIDSKWPGPKENLSHVVVWFRTDDKFVKEFPKKLQEYASQAGGYLGTCARNFKTSVPMIVIRERHMQEVLSTGEPVIHELCHVMLNQYFITEHEEKNVWAKFGDTTNQAEARYSFSVLKDIW